MRVLLYFLYLATAIGLILIAGLGFLVLSPNYNAGVFKGKSMSPTINSRDLIITTRVREEIKPGMIIGYSLLTEHAINLLPNYQSELILHRVIWADSQNFTAKGDANEEPDPWQLPISAVKEVYLFKIPYFFGYVGSFLAIFLTTFFISRKIARKKNREVKGGKHESF